MIHLIFAGGCAIVLAYIAYIRGYNKCLEECTEEEEKEWNI